MRVAVQRDLVPAPRDLAHELGPALGRDAEHEEGRPHPRRVERVEHRGRVVRGAVVEGERGAAARRAARAAASRARGSNLGQKTWRAATPGGERPRGEGDPAGAPARARERHAGADERRARRGRAPSDGEPLPQRHAITPSRRRRGRRRAPRGRRRARRSAARCGGRPRRTRAARAGSRAMRTIARAQAAGSSGGSSSPSTPGCSTSRNPSMSEASTGVPAAIASSSVTPKLAIRVGAQ